MTDLITSSLDLLRITRITHAREQPGVVRPLWVDHHGNTNRHGALRGIYRLARGHHHRLTGERLMRLEGGNARLIQALVNPLLTDLFRGLVPLCDSHYHQDGRRV